MNASLIKRALNIMYEISRVSLFQSSTKRVSYLVDLWALIVVILTVYSSGRILSSLVVKNRNTINTFEDLMSSNMKIICVTDSFMYYAIKFAQYWKDDKLLRLRDSDRVDYRAYDKSLRIHGEAFVMKELAQRKSALIWDQINSGLKRSEYLHYNLEFANEKFYPLLMGFPINRRSLLKDKLYKL